MTTRAWLPSLAAFGVLAATMACGSNPKPQAVVLPPVIQQTPAQTPAPPPTPPPPPVDPIAVLIQTSQAHFEAGERELKAGHLDRARTEFDKAVDVMLESPYGARTDARTRQHFDRLIDRINAYEVTALAAGDGLAEKKYEPASIDDLLTIATFPKPDAQPVTAEAVKADLAATEHDVPIPQSARVLSYVELFQTRLHDYMHESLTRGTKYLPMIQNVFRAEGLPLDLAYIPIIESAFKPNALSKASAKGPWQFMKATAVENGLKHDWFIDERSDPEKATVAAAKYLKTLSRMFNGDWHLVLAAYNGGLGRLQRAMKRAHTEDFWDLSVSTRYLPKETREYVPMILAAIIIARNPAQYGFEIVAAEPPSFDKVAVPKAIDLRRVAEWTGTSVDEIQALNPELRRWTTPIKYPEFELKVPAGTGSAFQAKLADASSADLATLKWYTVKSGESLQTIARKQKVSRTDLAEANGMAITSRVRPGQELIIPRVPGPVLTARTEHAAPTEVASRSLSGTATIPAPHTPEPTTIVYRVKRGDTLSSIARVFNTTVDKIRAMNRLTGNVIAAGERLKIQTSRPR